MNILRSLMIAGCVLALAACGNFGKHSDIDALNEVQAVGSPFTQHLANEYRDFANSELAQYDYPDALHFARKGLAAAAGEPVLPEPISDWNLLPHHMQELGTARGRLIVAFDLGAREMFPRESAIAQVRFDCWIEEQEENWQMEDIARCKNEFMNAMANLESMMQPMMMAPPELVPPPREEPMALPAEAQPMLPEESMYLTFFDFDQHTLNAGAQSVLDAVRDEITRRGTVNVINVVGHTDSAGPRAYNDRLALRRANAVRDALIERGVDPGMIRVEGRGQNDLLVQTADGVREPANRRAQITFD